MLRLSRAKLGTAFVVAISALLSACGGSPDGATLSPDALHVRCLEQPDTGSCGAAKPAFYYDYSTDSCRQFLWGGCGANLPFESMEACVSACGGRAQR